MDKSLAETRKAADAARNSANAAQETIFKMQTIADGQNTDMRDSIDQATRAANEMANIAKSMASNLTLLETSVSHTKRLADITELGLHSSNRAYLSINSQTPGLMFKPNPANSEHIDASIFLVITNGGQTPAIVTCTAFQLFVTEGDDLLPPEPRYSPSAQSQRRRATIGPGRDLVAFHNFPLMRPDALRDILQERERLYLIGYVDFIDAFGERYRAGYGRIYTPSIDRFDGDDPPPQFAARMNLHYTTQGSYNDEWKRKQGEGDDWDTPQQQPQPDETGLS